jgi:sugar phosphate isomerase/epimerase
MKLALTVTPSLARLAPIVMRGPLEPSLALASELGYDGIELHLRRPDDIDRAALKELAGQNGLGFSMIGTGMIAGEDGLTFADPDPAVRSRALERIKEHIELARYLGAAVAIGLIRGSLGKEPELRDQRRGWFEECLQECCAEASRAGVTLVLEPINRYETDCLNTVDECLAVLDRIRSPHLKLLLDTFHMNIEEADIPTSFRRAAVHLGHVHLADSNRQAPCHGHLDVRGVLSVLHEVNYRGYIAFEVLPLPNPRQAAEDAIRTVRRLLTSLEEP